MTRYFSSMAGRKALVVISIAILATMAVVYVMATSRQAQASIDQIEPRYARLLGLRAGAGELEQALSERRAALARRAYSANQDLAVAGSDAQQRAREVFAKAGLQITSIQLLPAKNVEGFDRIPVVLRLDGEFAELQSALAALSRQAPTLFVDGFNLQTVGMPRAEGPQKLNMQVNLFVLRART